ncbi:MAG: response regulator [Chloroflexota bacterium]
MKTALVIDDNQETADVVCQMLDLLDVDATAAYGPRVAMTLLKDFSPDIIFLDINMPGVDGFEVMAYLRRYPNLEHTPVVFVTSDDQPETVIKARKTGALLVIIKPMTFEALEATLRKVGLI